MQYNKTSAFWKRRAKHCVTFNDIFMEHILFEYISFLFNFPQLALNADYYTEKGIAIFIFLLHKSINSNVVMVLDAFSPQSAGAGKLKHFWIVYSFKMYFTFWTCFVDEVIATNCRPLIADWFSAAWRRYVYAIFLFLLN